MRAEDVRRWIQRTNDEGEDIYVVVSYHTIRDARIAEQSGKQKVFGGKFAMPIPTALAATGVGFAQNDFVT